MDQTIPTDIERSGRDREAGFTLLEIMIGAFFLQIGLMALASGFIVHSRASNETRDADLQKLAGRNMCEILRSETFTDLVTDYGPTGNDTFWCDEEGNVSFTAAPSDAAVTGTITLYDDIASIPASFADLSSLFTPGTDAADKLYAELGVLPVRLTMTQGTNVTTMDFLLSKGGF